MLYKNKSNFLKGALLLLGLAFVTVAEGMFIPRKYRSETSNHDQYDAIENNSKLYDAVVNGNLSGVRAVLAGKNAAQKFAVLVNARNLKNPLNIATHQRKYTIVQELLSGLDVSQKRIAIDYTLVVNGFGFHVVKDEDQKLLKLLLERFDDKEQKELTRKLKSRYETAAFAILEAENVPLLHIFLNELPTDEKYRIFSLRKNDGSRDTFFHSVSKKYFDRLKGSSTEGGDTLFGSAPREEYFDNIYKTRTDTTEKCKFFKILIKHISSSQLASLLETKNAQDLTPVACIFNWAADDDRAEDAQTVASQVVADHEAFVYMCLIEERKREFGPLGIDFEAVKTLLNPLCKGRTVAALVRILEAEDKSGRTIFTVLENRRAKILETVEYNQKSQFENARHKAMRLKGTLSKEYKQVYESLAALKVRALKQIRMFMPLLQNKAKVDVSFEYKD